PVGLNLRPPAPHRKDVMGSLIAAAGALWIAVIMWDAFEAIVLPRRVTRPQPPSHAPGQDDRLEGVPHDHGDPECARGGDHRKDVMGSLIAAAGALWIAVIMWDAFEAIVLPRRVTRRLRPARMFYRVTWRVWSSVP